MVNDSCNALDGDRLVLRSSFVNSARSAADLIDLERREAIRVNRVPETQQASTRNLFHYLALRRHDIRPMQEQLARLGLSSLGRAESHVLATVDAVLSVLHHLAGRPWQPTGGVDARRGIRRGDRPARCPYGGPSRAEPAERAVRIMVTMPSEASEDYLLCGSCWTGA